MALAQLFMHRWPHLGGTAGGAHAGERMRGRPTALELLQARELAVECYLV